MYMYQDTFMSRDAMVERELMKEEASIEADRLLIEWEPPQEAMQELAWYKSLSRPYPTLARRPKQEERIHKALFKKLTVRYLTGDWRVRHWKEDACIFENYINTGKKEQCNAACGKAYIRLVDMEELTAYKRRALVQAARVERELMEEEASIEADKFLIEWEPPQEAMQELAWYKSLPRPDPTLAPRTEQEERIHKALFKKLTVGYLTGNWRTRHWKEDERIFENYADAEETGQYITASNKAHIRLVDMEQLTAYKRRTLIEHGDREAGMLSSRTVSSREPTTAGDFERDVRLVDMEQLTAYKRRALIEHGDREAGMLSSRTVSSREPTTAGDFERDVLSVLKTRNHAADVLESRNTNGEYTAFIHNMRKEIQSWGESQAIKYGRVIP
jgi:hypothetical protein